MDYEFVKKFLNKRVKLSVAVSQNDFNYYTGKIVIVNPDYLVILDKYNTEVGVSLDTIKQISEVMYNGYH